VIQKASEDTLFGRRVFEGKYFLLTRLLSHVIKQLSSPNQNLARPRIFSSG